SAGFAGTLTSQWGVLGYAGISAAKSGAKVTSAYGGEFVISNNVAGTTITNAYGVFISNTGTAGGGHRPDSPYASGPTAQELFCRECGNRHDDSRDQAGGQRDGEVRRRRNFRSGADLSRHGYARSEYVYRQPDGEWKLERCGWRQLSVRGEFVGLRGLR